jgi:hypothetical protein
VEGKNMEIQALQEQAAALQRKLLDTEAFLAATNALT